MIKTNLEFEYALQSDEFQTVFSQIKDEMQDIGYYNLPDHSDLSTVLIKHFVSNIKPIKNLIVLGIGGSSLGLRAIDESLKNTKARKDINLILLEHLDPIKTSSMLKNIKLKDSFICVISKSGATIETASLFKYVLSHLKLNLEDTKSVKKSLAFITDESSPLDKLAHKYCASVFYIPKNVGGRFSVLSAVGLVPLAILGYNIDALLKGAAWSKHRFFISKQDDVIKKAHFYATNAKQRPINTLFIYSSELAFLGSWYVQLWAESLGKINNANDNVGLTPISMVGSVDQHSFLQLIVQGARDKTVTFIKVKHYKQDLKIPNIKLEGLESTDYANGQRFSAVLNAQCDATKETLIEQGVPCDEIILDTINEPTIGALIFYFELLTSCAAKILDVNCYDQPGVEFGKKKLVSKFNERGN